MSKWHELGIQINRLVYALAGRKFQADIDMANRFIAERIFYSEVSVRMMRQGRFRPREEHALEMLVEIGKLEAELGYEWACQLLQSGRHSNPEAVLQKTFPQHNAVEIERFIENKSSAFSTAVSRIAGSMAGSFIALLVWTYVINPTYPAPHELSILKEIVWGFSIGLGLAGGLIAVDYFLTWRLKIPFNQHWLGYLYLPAGGVLGALMWKAASSVWFAHLPYAQIHSTWLETLSFGFLYGLAFAIGIIMANKQQHLSRKSWQILLTLGLGCGGLSLVGFILAILQPAFANQKDIDIFVGLMLRFGLIVLVSVLFPVIPGRDESGLN